MCDVYMALFQDTLGRLLDSGVPEQRPLVTEISRRNRSFPSVLAKAVAALAKDGDNVLASAAVFAAHPSLLEEAGAGRLFEATGSSEILSKVGRILHLKETLFPPLLTSFVV